MKREIRPVLRRLSTFGGQPESVREARRWVRNHLPDCEAQEDTELLVSELTTNAVRHTRSGTGGTFGVDLSWWPDADFVRLVVADWGGTSKPQVIHHAMGETNRGLEAVEGIAAAWGHVGDHRGRWVWADIPWSARGGAMIPVKDGSSLVNEELTILRQRFTAARVWLDAGLRAWCGWPDTDSKPSICAPSPLALSALLSARMGVPVSRSAMTGFYSFSSAC